MSEKNVHALLDDWMNAQEALSLAKLAAKAANAEVVAKEAVVSAAHKTAKEGLKLGQATVHRGKVITTDTYGDLRIKDLI